MTQSERQQLGLILMLAFLVVIGPLSVDAYLPALPALAKEFSIGSALAQQSVSVFFIGIAAGQLIAGPLSDRFGRRPILLTGFAIYFLSTIACALAQDIHTLIWARALQGLAAAATPAAGRAMVRDIWQGDQAARAMSYVTMAVIIGPLIAPTLGGIIVTHLNWRAIFWLLLLLASLSLALILLRLPETNGPDKRQGVHLIDYFRAYARVLRRQQAWAYLLCGGLPYAAMYAYITNSPSVYIEIFGVTPTLFGVFFGVNVAGLFIGTWINSRLVTRYGYHRLLAGGVSLSLLGSLLFLAASWWQFGGLTAVVICLFITVAPASMVGANNTVGLMNLFPANAGAAVALFGVAQFGLGALASLFVGLIYDGTTFAMAISMATTLFGSFLALIWLLRCRRRDAAII